jgi:hypothetical protein
VPDPNAAGIEMATVKQYKSPGIGQIPVKLIKARARTIRSEIHKLINSVRNKEKLPELCK